MRTRTILATTVAAVTVAAGSTLVLAGGTSSPGSSADPVAAAAPSSSAAAGEGGEGRTPAVADPSTDVVDGAAVGDTVVTVLPGDGSSRPDALPVEPLGEVDVHGYVPAGLDLTAFPGAPGAPTTSGLQGADSFSAGWGCAVQCITGGVAYPRGYGAELVVDTSVDADLFLSVIGDADGDGEYEYGDWAWSEGRVDHMTWALDDLEPGRTYYAMVSAVDAEGGHSLAYGELTTLAHRTVFVSMGDLTITGGKPDDGSRRYLAVDGSWSDHTPGQEGIHLHHDLPDSIDLRMGVTRHYDRDLCEATLGFDQLAPHGYDAGGCTAWNTTEVSVLDLAAGPAGATRWNESELQTTMQTSAGDGALPAGYGEPYFFHFSAPVTFWVQYS